MCSIRSTAVDIIWQNAINIILILHTNNYKKNTINIEEKREKNIRIQIEIMIFLDFQALIFLALFYIKRVFFSFRLYVLSEPVLIELFSRKAKTIFNQ